MEHSNKDFKAYTVDTNLSLTDQERMIFDTLLGIVKDNQLKTTLRVAGGWVRDKVRIVQN